MFTGNRKSQVLNVPLKSTHPGVKDPHDSMPSTLLKLPFHLLLLCGSCPKELHRKASAHGKAIKKKSRHCRSICSLKVNQVAGGLQLTFRIHHTHSSTNRQM